MKKLLKACAVVTLSSLLFVTSHAVAGPASYVVRQGGSEVWVFASGLAVSEDAVPDEMRRVIATSREVWFESPEGGDPADIKRFIAANGTDAAADLFAQLSPLVAERLEQVIRAEGLAREQFAHAKPWWAYLQLNSLQGAKMRKAGAVIVEETLRQEAKAAGVQVQSEFSSRTAQLQWFVGLPPGAQLCALEWQLDRLKGLEAETQAEMRSWVAGDGANAETMRATLLLRCPALYQAMGPDRNKAWIPRIQEMLRTPGRSVVVVGEAHLTPDPLGMPALLQAAGMTVERR